MVPDGLRVRCHDEGSMILEPLPREDGETPDYLVGTVPLIEWDSKNQRPRVHQLEVAPPPPFGSADAQSMWRQVVAASVRPLSSVRLQGGARGSASSERAGLDPDAVPAALGALMSLERSWPQLQASETVWRAADLRGGREDDKATDRLGAARAGITTSTGTRIPDVTARLRGSSQEWGSQRLASACLALDRALAARSQELPGSSLESRRVVMSVARRSYRYAPGVDAPPSSWPTGGRNALMGVVRALLALAAEGAGSALVPLSDLWRLYETWTCVVALEALTAEYGLPEQVDDVDWAWQWQIGEVKMRMHTQGSIGGSVNAAITGHTDGVVSVSSELVPDLLLSLWQEDGGQALICGDAKQRTLGSAMKAGDIAEAASKYLWGLRFANDLTAPASSRAIIVSSAPVSQMLNEQESRTAAVHLLPGVGRGEFAAMLTETVREAAKGL